MIVVLITVVIIKRKTITLVIDGKKSTIITYKDTVRKALENDNIEIVPEDIISPKLDSSLKDKQTITIKKAVKVQLQADGKTFKINSALATVADLLKTKDITLGEKDKITPAVTTALSKDLNIVVTRVEVKTITDKTALSFNTIVKNNDALANSVKKTVQEGKNGEKSTTTEVVYEDGKEVSRKVVLENITSKPVDQIISQGTLPVLPISRGGDPVPYTKVFKAKATAYSAIHGIGHTYSSSGRLSVRNPNGYSTIAVDPSVIPLGTRVYVERYGFATAADTGTAIKGNIIDVFFDTSAEANKWAVKSVNVYILK